VKEINKNTNKKAIDRPIISYIKHELAEQTNI